MQWLTTLRVAQPIGVSVERERHASAIWNERR